MLLSSSQAHNSLQEAAPPRFKPQRPLWQQLLLVVAYFLAALFIGQFVGVVLAALIYQLSLEQVPQILSSLDHPYSRQIIYLLQGCSAGFGFILGPLLYIYHWGAPVPAASRNSPTNDRASFANLLNPRQAAIIPLALAGLVTLSFMVVNSPIIEWNAAWELPAGWETFELWASSMEESAARITRHMVEFSTLGDFLLALLIIAGVAAVGEELLFRGLLQPILGKISRNAHLGIWLSALFFSLFHFQLFGLVPRMALGVVFGYLFYWSGSLIMPILGHFINNGLTLFLAYLAQLGYIEYNLEDTEALPTAAILVCLVVGVGAVWAYRRYYQKLAAHE